MIPIYMLRTVLSCTTKYLNFKIRPISYGPDKSSPLELTVGRLAATPF